MTIVDRKDLSVDLEYNEDLCVIHLPYVEKFTKTSYSRMRDTFEEVKTFVATMGFEHLYAAIPTTDKTTLKLPSKFGLEYLADEEGLSIFRSERLNECLK